MSDTKFLYDIYGRMQMEVLCHGQERIAYRIVGGRRSKETDFVIPEGLDKEQTRTYLDDMFHEMARLGEEVKLISDKIEPK